jgi:membrane protein required for colicin V production
MPITLLDGILAGFTLVSAMLAMVRGFSREILSIASWVAAAAAAYFFYPLVVPYLAPYVDSDKIRMAAAAGVVFVVALIIVTLITMRIADFIIDSRIGALDRALGFLYGAARGILVVAVGLLFFNWLVGAHPPAWITDAKSRPFLEQIGAKIENLLPQDSDNLLKKYLPGGGGEDDNAAPAEGTGDTGADSGADNPPAEAPADAGNAQGGTTTQGGTTQGTTTQGSGNN